MSTIQAEAIRVAYEDRVIIDSLSTAIPKEKITTIIGSNGCGKSTLLKALTRILPLQAGAVYLDGQAIAQLPTKEVAKKLALLPQVLEATEGISVYELVSYGRFPHQNGLGYLSDLDREKVNWALEVTQTTAYARLPVDDLSGGQRQRVWIAMALAQDTDTTKMTPVLMSFFVFFFVFLISGMALLKERTTGTLDRLLATPVKRSDIVFGYMMAYSLVAALQTIVIVLSTIWLLNLEVLGNIGDVIIVNIIFALVALSFGLLLSTLAKSEFQMMQFIPLVVLPQIFFSGIIPLDAMADWVQSLGKLLPLYYAGHALSKIILNGTSILQLGFDISILLIFLLVLTILNVIGLKRYRKV